MYITSDIISGKTIKKYERNIFLGRIIVKKQIPIKYNDVSIDIASSGVFSFPSSLNI